MAFGCDCKTRDPNRTADDVSVNTLNLCTQNQIRNLLNYQNELDIALGQFCQSFTLETFVSGTGRTRRPLASSNLASSDSHYQHASGTRQMPRCAHRQVDGSAMLCSSWPTCDSELEACFSDLLFFLCCGACDTSTTGPLGPFHTPSGSSCQLAIVTPNSCPFGGKFAASAGTSAAVHASLLR